MSSIDVTLPRKERFAGILIHRGVLLVGALGRRCERAGRRLTSALTILLAVAPALAVTLDEIPLESLGARAEAVVHGRVIRTEGRWTDDRTMIVSLVAIEVRAVVRGRAEPMISVKQLGGSVGDVGMSVSEEPLLQPGDEVVLFLDRWPDGTYRIAGSRRGASHVTGEHGVPILRGGVADGIPLDELARRLAPP